MSEERIIEGYKVKVKKTKEGYEAAVEDLSLKVNVKEENSINACVRAAITKYFRELYSLPEKKSRLDNLYSLRKIKKRKKHAKNNNAY